MPARRCRGARRSRRPRWRAPRARRFSEIELQPDDLAVDRAVQRREQLAVAVVQVARADRRQGLAAAGCARTPRRASRRARRPRASGTSTNTHQNRRKNPFFLVAGGVLGNVLGALRTRGGVDRHEASIVSSGWRLTPRECDGAMEMWLRRRTDAAQAQPVARAPGGERLAQVVPLAARADLDDVAAGARVGGRHAQAGVDRPDAPVLVAQALAVDVGQQHQLDLAADRAVVLRGLAHVLGGPDQLGVGVADVGEPEHADLGVAQQRALGEREVDDPQLGPLVAPQRRALRPLALAASAWSAKAYSRSASRRTRRKA